MNKQVSPAFAIIVILVVVALGALYFLMRFRAYETKWAEESRALQAQANAARRAGRGMMGGQRPGRGMRRAGGAAGPGSRTRQPGRVGAIPTPQTRGR